MKINIRQWNKYKNRIALEYFKEPFDWLEPVDQRKVILVYQDRLNDGTI